MMGYLPPNGRASGISRFSVGLPGAGYSTIVWSVRYDFAEEVPFGGVGRLLSTKVIVRRPTAYGGERTGGVVDVVDGPLGAELDAPTWEPQPKTLVAKAIKTTPAIPAGIRALRSRCTVPMHRDCGTARSGFAGG